MNKAGGGLSEEIALTNVEQQVQISSNRLVSALSGLTMGVNTLAMGDEARVQALASSSIEVKPVGLEQPETGEGGPERKEQVHTLNKKDVAINYVCGAGKNKIEAHIDV